MANNANHKADNPIRALLQRLWRRVLLDKLIVAQLNSSPSVKHEVSLLCSQEPATETLRKFRNTLLSTATALPTPNLKDHPLLGCLFIQYTCSYPPYLESRACRHVMPQ